MEPYAKAERSQAFHHEAPRPEIYPEARPGSMMVSGGLRPQRARILLNDGSQEAFSSPSSSSPFRVPYESHTPRVGITLAGIQRSTSVAGHSDIIESGVPAKDGGCGEESGREGGVLRARVWYCVKPEGRTVVAV
ncbi:hypothetical protein VE03_01975 [Pseudogymnoascus sp. 23342-1-I1]|nr:hypothetical protein VE03_01975 [Pseudogymnoascus sp. 23342-1-I1]